MTVSRATKLLILKGLLEEKDLGYEGTMVRVLKAWISELEGV